MTHAAPWHAFLGLSYAEGATPELGRHGRPLGPTDCQGVVLAFLRARGVPAPDASLRGQAAYRWWDAVDGPPEPLDVVTSDPYEAGCASHVSVAVGGGTVLSAGKRRGSFAEPLWRVRRRLGVYRFRRRTGLSQPGAGLPPAGDPPAPGALLDLARWIDLARSERRQECLPPHGNPATEPQERAAVPAYDCPTSRRCADLEGDRQVGHEHDLRQGRALDGFRVSSFAHTNQWKRLAAVGNGIQEI